jgi:hypothetical protein
MFSERFNPWMLWVAPAARLVAEQRRPAPTGNPFLALEREASGQVAEAFARWRVLRDACQEEAFRAIFGSSAGPAALETARR